MKSIIAVTGTPGVGKSHFAKLLKKKCPGIKVIEINDLVESYKAFSKYDRFGAKIVNIRKLNQAVKIEIKKKGGCIVLVGHLAPELSLKYDIAIVLRSKLITLKKRLKKRAYPDKKIGENIISESFDYCGEKMKNKCKEIYEIETTKEVNNLIRYIARLCCGKARALTPKPKQKSIDKSDELLELLKKGEIVQ